MKKMLMAFTTLPALLLTGCAEDVSMGIIGGADGPTALFISVAPYWWVPYAIIIGIIAAAVAAAVRIRRRRKK